MTDMKNKVKARELLLGTMLSEVSNPNIVRILKTVGFEYIIVDCEHGYFDFSQIANIISVGNGFGMPIIIRIPAIEREFITKVLDMGADGLLVPMVSTEQEAEMVVKFAKYSPVGMRGLSTTRAHTNYNPPPLKEYIKIANDRTIIFVQIETKQGVENADKIAAVNGIDAVMIGPNDLAMDYGTPGILDSDSMMKAVSHIVRVSNSAGKASGMIASNVSYLHRCEDIGMSVFSCNSEVGMILNAGREVVNGFLNKI